MATKLNFLNWRLVDLDNFMLGNKPFSKEADEQDQE